MRTNTRFQTHSQPHAFLRVVALLLVVLMGLAPASSAIWQCEGRVCGTSSWACCCALPQPKAPTSPECDPQSSTRTAHIQSSVHGSEVGACSVACHCTKVTQSRGAVVGQSHQVFVAPLFQVAVLPRVYKLDAPLVVCSSRPLPSRGPPLTSFSFVSPSLRAPPVA